MLTRTSRSFRAVFTRGTGLLAPGGSTVRTPYASQYLGTTGAGSGALLVIAHPDDECMFFTPTLLGLQRQGVAVHVLCLSTGNFAGLGATRARELRASCTALGVAEGHVRPNSNPNPNPNPNPNRQPTTDNRQPLTANRSP